VRFSPTLAAPSPDCDNVHGFEANDVIERSELTTCISYGAAAALTLDEFALWLNLRDVYWAKEGRASLDAVVLFSALLLVGISGAPLWRGLVRQLGRRT
jgi:hypothetical protein